MPCFFTSDQQLLTVTLILWECNSRQWLMMKTLKIFLSPIKESTLAAVKQKPAAEHVQWVHMCVYFCLCHASMPGKFVQWELCWTFSGQRLEMSSGQRRSSILLLTKTSFSSELMASDKCVAGGLSEPEVCGSSFHEKQTLWCGFGMDGLNYERWLQYQYPPPFIRKNFRTNASKISITMKIWVSVLKRRVPNQTIPNKCISIHPFIDTCFFLRKGSVVAYHHFFTKSRDTPWTRCQSIGGLNEAKNIITPRLIYSH